MAISMTGFGRAESVFTTRRYCVEIKSVNNRYCDIQLRMPRAYLVFDPKIRERVTAALVRGKIDVFVTIEDVGDGNTTVEANLGLAKAYSDAIQEIAAATGREDHTSSYDIARMQDVLTSRAVTCTEEEMEKELFSVLDMALSAISNMRRIEGNRLVADLDEKLKVFSTLHQQVSERAPLVPQEFRAKLMARMEELLADTTGLYFDEARRDAEVAIFADRCAIDEEVTRLTSHIAQLSSTLHDEGSIGKRLDFLLQEMNREVNTIGSKANDLEITNNVLAMKNELEKIREQIQNLA